MGTLYLSFWLDVLCTPSFFLIPFRVLNFLIKAYQRIELHKELVCIHQTLRETHNITGEFYEKAATMIQMLNTYLLESEAITEEELTYIDEFASHLTQLKEFASGRKDLKMMHQNICQLHNKVRSLADRPTPSISPTFR